MQSWHEIVSHHGPLVWRTVFRLLRHHADAEECFQETFLAAVELARQGEVRHWPALLQRLATARAVDRLRERVRRGGQQAVQEWDTIDDHGVSPPQAAEDAELADSLGLALARLPASQAEVFCLHCLEGWSYREIAAQLDLSVDAVGVQLHRARKQLRELLAAALDVRKDPP